MKPVISDSGWKEFCTRRELPLAQAVFAISTCYYGIGLRSRPGTLILTRAELIHYSYALRDTYYAIFEPSIPIAIALGEIDHVAEQHFGFWRRLFLTQPEACFEVVTRAGERHHLVLQRGGDGFRAALSETGIAFQR